MLFDPQILPDARGGVASMSSKPPRRRSLPESESDPETEEMIRRIWHEQDDDGTSTTTCSHFESESHQEDQEEICPHQELQSGNQEQSLQKVELQEHTEVTNDNKATEEETIITDEDIQEQPETSFVHITQSDTIIDTEENSDEYVKEDTEESLPFSDDLAVNEIVEKIVKMSEIDTENDEDSDIESVDVANREDDKDSGVNVSLDAIDVGFHRSASLRRESSPKITNSSKRPRSLIARFKPKSMESPKPKTDAAKDTSVVAQIDKTPVKRKESLRERLQRSVKSSGSKKRSSLASPGPSRPPLTPILSPDSERSEVTPTKVSKLPEISEARRNSLDSIKSTNSKIPKFKFSKRT